MKQVFTVNSTMFEKVNVVAESFEEALFRWREYQEGEREEFMNSKYAYDEDGNKLEPYEIEEPFSVVRSTETLIGVPSK